VWAKIKSCAFTSWNAAMPYFKYQYIGLTDQTTNFRLSHAAFRNAMYFPECVQHDRQLPVLLHRSIFMPRLAHCGFIFTKENLLRISKTLFGFFVAFYSCMSMKLHNFKLCNLKLHNSGSVLQGSFQNQKLLRII
jgi:hypothetical protein